MIHPKLGATSEMGYARREYFFKPAARFVPTLPPAHAGEFNAVQDQGQIAPAQLDASVLSIDRPIPLAWRLKRTPFPDGDRRSPTRPPTKYNTLTRCVAAIEEQEQMARLHLLGQLLFHQAAKPVEALPHVGRPGVDEDTQRGRREQHQRSPPGGSQ